MTVSSQTNKETFTGNGVTTIWDLPFRFFHNDEIFVYLVDPVAFTTTPLVLGTDYTLTGAGLPEQFGTAPGKITTTVPVASLKQLYVERIMSIEQLTDIVNQGRFFPEVHEDVFDRLTMLIQQADSNSRGAIRVAIGDPEPARLPSAPLRANLLMGFDGLGNPIPVAPSGGSTAALALMLANESLVTQGAAMIGRANQVVKSIAELKTLLKNTPSKFAFVTGYYAQGDGGGGDYWLDSSDTTSADNSGSIIVAADGGRWKLVSQIISPEQFGAKSDNITDDTAAIQKWVEYTGRLGGGTLKLTQGNTYYVPGTVIVPNWVSLDLNGCTMRGNRGGGSTASMFKTGYFNGSNVLVTNVGAAVDITIVDGVQIKNGKILEAYRALEFTNANRTCAVENMTFTGCVQSWLFFRCWSMKLDNCFTDTNSVFGTPSYKWSQAINAINCNQVRAITDFGFEFSGGITGSGSIVLINCDVEGSANRAFYFQGQFYGVHWVGGYFEGIPGCVYDFADVTQITATWTGTFNYLSGVLMREPTSLTATLDGEWDTSNAIVGVTVGLPYPTQLNVSHPRNNIKFRLANNFASTTTLPANVLTSGSGQADVECISTRWGTGSGDVLSRGICSAGVIPLRYSGDVGRAFANQVAFATHAAFNPGSSTIVILVTTKIVWRADTMFAKYRFTVTDSGGSYNLFGDIYGGFAKSQDGVAGKTITAVNSGGFLRLELYGFTHPTGVYTCTGTVQLCT